MKGKIVTAEITKAALAQRKVYPDEKVVKAFNKVLSRILSLITGKEQQ